MALLVAVAVEAALPVEAAAPAPQLPRLHAQGTRIVDEAGRPVLLRGVNLGGWLVEEMWMMPFVTQPPDGSAFAPIRDHVTLWNVLKGRFGEAGARRLRTGFRNAWLDEADFDRIREAGFNSVRLPFLYDLLDEPGGWTWLDRGIEWAARRGLYTVLDLHGAPGRQSADHHTGEQGVNRLFRDPGDVAEAERVWAKVARRYRDRFEVVAFDLLNEPMGAPNVSTLYTVQDRLFRAVRRAAPRTMILVEEGYTGFEKMPFPAVSGWDNGVLSMHAYQFDAKAESDHMARYRSYEKGIDEGLAARQTPFYLGEFNFEPYGTPETMTNALRFLAQNDWSWAVWTYKVVMERGDSSMWGLYRNTRPVEPLNPFTDTEADLLRKAEQTRTSRLDLHQSLQAAYRSSVPGAAPSPAP